MKNKDSIGLIKYWRPIVGVIGLAVVLVWTSGACTQKVKPGKADAEIGFAVPGNAETIEISVKPLSTRIYVVGTTASEEKINISARIPAYVKEVFINAGDTVQKGQNMITLDDRDILKQVAAAEAHSQHADSEYKRARELFDKNATTQQALTAAESMAQAAKAQLEQAKIMLTYAQINAPIDGIVTDRRIEAGDIANPGMPLLAVYDPSRVRLEVPVPVRLIDRLSLGQKVDVELERPARVFKAQITEIVSEVDPATRTQLVKAKLDVGSGEVLPGVFGRLWVKEEPRDAFVAPKSAVYTSGQLEMVQVVKEGRVIRRLVKTGPAYGDSVEILSGLKEGDLILAKPKLEN
ncbi:MAG: efflux RND transporter periplasmic adaptor subunit [Lentisphaerae bacterium]|nr:efflux RND transporter periplasmic adaptor subunit [Lentisphaerota bacterium]